MGRLEGLDESSEKSKMLSNMSDTIVKKASERKITLLKPSALILENKITA